jgi:hypothetical protein
MARKRIQWPFKGRVDNNARGDQPELTTSDAKNVRNYAAGTERMQGGQRPGLSKLIDDQVATASDPVKAVRSLVYDRPAFNYSLARSVDWEGPNETDSSTVDVLVDEGGNSYWLTSDAIIEKRNADGVLIWSEAVPLGTFTALDRFAIDADGNIYVALKSPDAASGRIIKLEVTEDDDAATLVWIFETDEGEYADIYYRAGTLFVAVNQSDVERAFAYAIGSLDGTEPVVNTTYDLTYPVRQIAVCKGGLVYATAPSDVRSDLDLTGGVGAGETDWTPLDLTNYEERLHCWLDAQGESAAAPGAQVGMYDRREEYRLASSLSDEFTDQTTRSHSSKVHGNAQLPKFDPNGLIIHPAYKFDPTVGSGDGGDTTPYLIRGSGAMPPQVDGIGEWHRDKVSTSDSLSRSQGLYPQVLTHTWATTMLVRTRTTDPMVLWALNMANTGNWQSNPFPNYIALTLHANGWPDSSGGHPDEAEYPYFQDYSSIQTPLLNQNYTQLWNTDLIPEPGAVALYTPYYKVPPFGGTSNTTTDVDIDTVSGLPVLQEHSSTETRAIEVHSPTISGSEVENVFLISIICEYDTATSEYRIRLRVNSSEDLTGTGPSYGVFQPQNFKRTPARDVLGSKVWGDYPGGTSGEVANSAVLGGFSSFDGWICEAITYFGDSSAASSPHDESYGNRGSGGFFDDVEKVEAYMAHKWGVASSVLDTSGGAGTVTGNQYKTTPPSGGGTTVSDAVTGTRITDALSSTQGITAKVSLMNNEHLWAYAGAGMGYALGVEETEGLIYTFGPKDLGYPTSGGNPIVGALNYDFGIIGRKLVDVGPFARIRRYGFAEIHFYENPQAGDTLAFSDGSTTNTITFVASGATGTQVNIGADLDATFDDATSGGFQEKVMAAVQGTGSFSVLTEPGYAIFAPKGATGTRVLRIYAQDFYTSPALDITSSEPTRFRVIFQQFPGSDGLKTSDPENSAWCFGGDYAAGTPDPDDINVRLAVDADGNAYVPSRGNLSGGTKQNHIYRLSRKAQSDVTDKVINTKVTGASGYGTNWQFDLNGQEGTDFAARAVAVKPELEHVYPSTSVDGPEYLWAANDNVKADGTTTPSLYTRHRIALINRTASNQDVRNVMTFAVAGTDAYRLNGSVWTSVGTVNKASGSAFTQMVPAYGQMFFVDNGLYTTYDPVKDGGTFEKWEAETAGEIPEGCRLAAFYRGRMVLGRSDKEPNTIFASAVGDPYDWDFFPKVDKLTKAFGGANQDTARNPDVVNALAPFYDDVLLVGGDHSITQYRGDLSEIGQIDYFTDVTGMAFGNSWALSPEGLMYFFGSRGGVWVMSPRSDGRTQPPIELTRDTIAEELRDIDLSQYLPKLVWDQECQGLHVFITPLTGADDATMKHYFFESRTKSWWPMTFGATTLHPYSSVLLEGLTPSDRKVAVGCEDGYVRVFDKTASNDDGTAIESDVLIGPIFAPDTPAEQRISSLHAIVANIGAGCRYTLYASDNPESLGTAVASGDLVAGYNDRVPARARGGYIWIKLENATGGGQWALESLHADLHLAGRRRDR